MYFIMIAFSVVIFLVLLDDISEHLHHIADALEEANRKDKGTNNE